MPCHFPAFCHLFAFFLLFSLKLQDFLGQAMITCNECLELRLDGVISIFVLKLPRLFTCLYGEEKSAAISKVTKHLESVDIRTIFFVFNSGQKMTLRAVHILICKSFCQSYNEIKRSQRNLSAAIENNRSGVPIVLVLAQRLSFSALVKKRSARAHPEKMRYHSHSRSRLRRAAHFLRLSEVKQNYIFSVKCF